MKSKIILATICIIFLSTTTSFGYTATFLPRLSVQEQYTDNVLLSEKDYAIIDDYITTVSPGFTAKLTGKKGDAEISYDPSYAFYNEFDEFNGWRHRAKISGMYMPAKHTRLNVRDNLLHTEDPIRYEDLALIRTEDPNLPVDTTERKTRRTYTTNFASVGLNHQFGEYHSFRLDFAHYLLKNDDPGYEDNQYYNPSAGVTYWFGPKWGFEVNGRYYRYEYDVSDGIDQYVGQVSLLNNFTKTFLGYVRYSHSVVNRDGDSEDDSVYNPSLGFKYNIEKDISLLFNVGYFYSDYEFRKDEQGASADIRLIKRFERGQIYFSALSGADYAFYGAEDLGFNLFYEVGVSGTYKFAKHLNGSIFGSYRNTEYKDFSDRRDKRPIVGVRLTWQALEWMDLGVNYLFRSVDSTIDTNDYDENRVSVKITLIPTVPFHTSRY